MCEKDHSANNVNSQKDEVCFDRRVDRFISGMFMVWVWMYIFFWYLMILSDISCGTLTKSDLKDIFSPDFVGYFFMIPIFLLVEGLRSFSGYFILYFAGIMICAVRFAWLEERRWIWGGILLVLMAMNDFVCRIEDFSVSGGVRYLILSVVSAVVFGLLYSWRFCKKAKSSDIGQNTISAE